MKITQKQLPRIKNDLFKNVLLFTDAVIKNAVYRNIVELNEIPIK